MVDKNSSLEAIPKTKAARGGSNKVEKPDFHYYLKNCYKKCCINRDCGFGLRHLLRRV